MNGTHKPFEDMSEQEFVAWLNVTIAALERKQRRETAYLDSRAGREAQRRTRSVRKLQGEQALLQDVVAFLRTCVSINEAIDAGKVGETA